MELPSANHTPSPPGRMPGSTAGKMRKMPAATLNTYPRPRGWPPNARLPRGLGSRPAGPPQLQLQAKRVGGLQGRGPYDSLKASP